ncbi:haloacid dehalogenase-like hydrolase domain-containing protein 3 [Hyalella azteca]|uniref:Haloacid dehalogenase-like hydrolase domain-containing protein 3 n=1 Tax=Hyalella azteca TaxID=294128 RepID=A0A8B7PMK2_HYAAZ|nr:haloacid dehalogenase-like hydrolase domain-containing protein 3 [Hyalella azteca]
MIRLITFDVNRTLLRLTASHPGEVYACIAAKYGYQCDPLVLGTAFRESYKTQSVESPTFGSGREDWKDWWRRVVLNTLKSSGVDINRNHLHAIAEDSLEIYAHAPAYTALPYAQETLQCLSDKRIALGVISNTDPRIKQVLLEHGFAKYFNFVLDSYSAGISKPHLGIFKQSLSISQLADLKPCEVLHVGDSLQMDYLGARKAGMQSTLVSPDFREQCSQHGFPVDNSSMFGSLKELVPQLLSIC